MTGMEGALCALAPRVKCGLESFESDGTREYGYLGWLREHFEDVKEFTQRHTLGLA